MAKHIYQTCDVCRRQFRVSKGEKPSTTCSPECRRLYLRGKRAEPPKCVTCGGPVELNQCASRQRITCSEKCAEQRRRARGKRGTQDNYCPTPEEIKAACEVFKAKHLDAKMQNAADVAANASNQ